MVKVITDCLTRRGSVYRPDDQVSVSLGLLGRGLNTLDVMSGEVFPLAVVIDFGLIEGCTAGG
jgi:hypothetical protein